MTLVISCDKIKQNIKAEIVLDKKVIEIIIGVNTLDKYEYRVRTEQMLEYMGQKEYKKAMEIADSIDWRKAKNAAMLCTASEIYEYNGEYEKSREILFIAYDRAPGSRKIVYRLGTLALKLNDVKEATDCYEEFIAMAPKDPNQYILRYKILKSQQAPLSQQIEALEEFKKAEYVEKWAYELAKLYHEAGMEAECLEECDDLILWFSEGKYVYQAMELKMKYKPLTPLQQEKYNHRNEEKKPVEQVTEEAVKPVEETGGEVTEESAEEVAEEVAEESAEEAAEEVTEESVEETAEEVVEEPAEETVEEVTEEPMEEVVEEAVEEVVEEVAEEAVEEPAEAIAEIAEESVEEVAANKEMFSQESKMSVEEILQNWEEKQKENAQMIQEEQEKAKREKEEQQVQKVEEESILPDDIRQLMEELEAEAAEIQTNKIRREEAPTSEKTQEKAVEEIVEPKPIEVEEPVEEIQLVEAPVKETAEDILTEEVEEEIEEDPFDEESFDEEAFEEVESDDFEEIEEIEEIEESEGIKLGDTQAIAISAKALMNDTVIEEPIEKEEEKQSTQRTSPFDTAFIVQGRYDLEAQSEIGIKAGLTEEQKKLFSYFVPVHGMSEQIVDVLENDKRCRTRYGTSRTANLLVVGRKGSGKTVLAVDIVKAIQKNRKLKQGKVGIVTAESLNKKDVSHIMEKLHGGAIIIERASKLNKKTVMELNDLMEEQTGELLVVLEEERRPLDKMLTLYPDFKKKFTSRLELPVFINDELVTFAQTYAKENGFKIDEMGILALYSRIDLLQREESIVTVADVKEIMDQAIEHSRKWTFKKFFKKLFGKKKTDSSRIVLQEEDFK